MQNEESRGEWSSQGIQFKIEKQSLLHEIEAVLADTFLHRVGPKIQGIFSKTSSITLKISWNVKQCNVWFF